jgi:hypothetical protein
MESLGLTVGSTEGFEQEHAESHARMSAVLPLEPQIQGYGHVLSSVLTKALIVTNAVEIDPENEESFVRQNNEVIVAAVRAALAQFMFSGVIQYGPAMGAFSIQMVDASDEEGSDDE